MSQASRISDLNFARDRRNCEPAEAPVIFVQKDGGFVEVKLPTKWAVCPVCRGEGKHVNPAIDAGGLSDEFDEDPEFYERYMGGAYDMQCNSCEGRSTVQVVDDDRLTDEQRAIWEQQQRDEQRDRQNHYYELRAGA